MEEMFDATTKTLAKQQLAEKQNTALVVTGLEEELTSKRGQITNLTEQVRVPSNMIPPCGHILRV
jgi:hypothetical protein